MNMIEQGLKKADQRGRKIGKKVRGEKRLKKWSSMGGQMSIARLTAPPRVF